LAWRIASNDISKSFRPPDQDRQPFLSISNRCLLPDPCTAPSHDTFSNMGDISCSHAAALKPHGYWIYTVQTAKTPSRWAIPWMRLWKTQCLRGFRRNLPQREPEFWHIFLKCLVSITYTNTPICVQLCLFHCKSTSSNPHALLFHRFFHRNCELIELAFPSRKSGSWKIPKQPHKFSPRVTLKGIFDKISREPCPPPLIGNSATVPYPRQRPQHLPLPQ